MIRTLNTGCASGRAAFTANFHHVNSHGAMDVPKRQPQDKSEVVMNEPGRMERDPVCAMMVGEWERQVVYLGVGYAFCSQQCRDRFTSGPGLYVGRRRILAPKQKGLEMIKRRRMLLGVPLTQAQFVELKGALLSMMGVITVRSVKGIVEGSGGLQPVESGTQTAMCIDAVEISYDLLQATAVQIECRFAEMNAIPSNGWGEKLLRDFVHYIEKCELDDLEIHDTDPVRWSRGTRRVASRFQTGAGTKTELRRLDLDG